MRHGECGRLTVTDFFPVIPASLGSACGAGAGIQSLDPGLSPG
jgi:hypothetical protein